MRRWKVYGNKGGGKRKYSKIIVAIVIALNAVFAAATLWAFVKVGSEPGVLIGAWFAFTTGELWMLSGIKKREIRREKNTTNDYREGGI